MAKLLPVDGPFFGGRASVRCRHCFSSWGLKLQEDGSFECRVRDHECHQAEVRNEKRARRRRERVRQ